MNVESFPYLIPYFVSAFISLGVAYYAWQRRQVAGSKLFVVMVLSQAVWTFGYMCELIAPTLQGKLFWDDVQFVASFIWPISFLAFAYEFSGRQWRRPRLIWSLLILPMVLFFLLLCTDGIHHIVRSESILVPGVPFSALYYEFTLVIWITAVYIYGLVAAGIYVLIRSFTQAHSLYRKQTGLVLIGTLFPIMGTLLTILGVSFSAQRDTTPLTFAISNVIIAWALYRYGLFDIVPIARDKVVENMSDLVLMLDRQNRFVDINPSAEEVLGMTTGELIGQPAGEVLVAWHYLLDLLARETEEVVEVEVPFEEKLYDLAIKITPLFDEQKKLNGRLIVARDITEMKQAERALQEHAAQLETVNEELLALGAVKDKFVTNVSHELRTPLANLKLYHDLLLRRPERLPAYTEILQRETERLELIIEDMLALSRLDQGRDVIQLEEVDLNLLIQTLVQDRQQLAMRAGVRLQFKLAEALPPIMIDASMLTQVLSILMTNAVNYTPEGGDILVFTQSEQRDLQHWLGFCVQDTGYGISVEEQNHLFTRFFRGNASQKSGNAGTGLGLSIAKEILDQHHGRITLNSTGIAGEGTLVHVWLPLTNETKTIR